MKRHISLETLFYFCTTLQGLVYLYKPSEIYLEQCGEREKRLLAGLLASSLQMIHKIETF